MEVSQLKRRHPLGLIAITFVLGPSALMLWMGRFKWSAFYFAASIVVIFLFFFCAARGLIPMSAIQGMDTSLLFWGLGAPLSIAGLAHAWRFNKLPPQRPWYSKSFAALPFYLVFSLLLAFGVRTYLFQPFNSPSGSSIPNLMVGDHYFASKTAYHSRDPVRGELAVFKKPNEPSVDYVKRVVGLPGDRIQMKSGILFLNGAAVPREEVQLPPRYSELGRFTFFREAIPGGQSYLIAEAFKEGPLDSTGEFAVPENHYFVLGDNRDNSTDSRIQSNAGVGYVPRANFVGPVTWLFWNANGFDLYDRAK